MKTIYINENILKNKILRESILMDTLPDDIVNAIFSKETSLGENPAIPHTFDNNFIEKCAKKRFEESKEVLKKIGEINDVDGTDIETVLNQLILKCQELERPIRDELEKACANFVIKFFGVPDDYVQLELLLTDKVDADSETIKLDPIPENDDIEYEDIKQIDELKGMVFKRRMLDALSMGAGMQVSDNALSYMNEISGVKPNLIDLYEKILGLNNYLLFTKNDLGLDDKHKMQLGTVEVFLGHQDEKVKIKSQGVIFPILLSETIRGFMELFASHGLPTNRGEAEMVLGRADYLKAEPWDMRVGPVLWTIISDSFEDVSSDLLPYLYKNIAKLSIKHFNILMNELLLKTKKGKRMLGKIVEKSKEQKNYHGFETKMQKIKTDKNINKNRF